MWIKSAALLLALLLALVFLESEALWPFRPDGPLDVDRAGDLLFIAMVSVGLALLVRGHRRLRSVREYGDPTPVSPAAPVPVLRIALTFIGAIAFLVLIPIATVTVLQSAPPAELAARTVSFVSVAVPAVTCGYCLLMPRERQPTFLLAALGSILGLFGALVVAAVSGAPQFRHAVGMPAWFTVAATTLAIAVRYIWPIGGRAQHRRV
jgi:hypothetical protein